MRPVPIILLTLFALAALYPLSTGAQTPAPSPSPVPSPTPAPSPTPKPAEIPDPLTDLQKASELTDKPEFRQSEIKPVPPLFNPEKEALFTVPSDYRKPGRLKIGAYFPQNDALKNATRTSFISLCGSLDLPPRGITRPFTPELYLDSAFYVQQDGNEASLIAGGVGFRFYPGAKPGAQTRKLSQPRPFVGAGIGAYFLNTKIGGTKNDGVKGGGKVSLGLDFVDDFSLEANYTFVGKLDETDFSGVSVLLAYRF